MQRSLSIDPVEARCVDVGGAADAAVEDIAARTNGAVHPSSPSQAADEIGDTIDASPDRPSTWAGGPYVGKVGDTLTLDGRGSYGVTSDLVRWEWDFDGSGTYDATGDHPTVRHTFAEPFDGVVALRVTDALGRTGLATAVAHITDDGDEIAGAADNCPDVSTSSSTAARPLCPSACSPTPRRSRGTPRRPC